MQAADVREETCAEALEVLLTGMTDVVRGARWTDRGDDGILHAFGVLC
jgi:hypothetical protein